jgi:hypothetical protein
MWPPRHSRPGQFRDHISGIPFYDEQGVDDMFATPTPVPGFDIYPQPANMPARPTTPVPGLQDDETDESLGDHQDSNNDNEEDDAAFENDHPADPARSESVHAYLYDDDTVDGLFASMIRKESRRPLYPLRPENFPPARGTGLGKTTVLIQKRPRVADEEHTGLGNAGDAIWGPSETPRPNSRGVETPSAAIKKRVRASSSPATFDAAGISVKVTSDIGPPPPPRPSCHHVWPIAAGGATVDGSHLDAGPSPKRQRLLSQSLTQGKPLPLSTPQNSAFTGTGTGSETRGDGRSSGMDDAPLRPSPQDKETARAAFEKSRAAYEKRADASYSLQAALARARARHLGVGGSETGTDASRSEMGPPPGPRHNDAASAFFAGLPINDDLVDMGPPPKRQRLPEHLPQRKPLPQREDAAKPAEVDRQRYGETAHPTSASTGLAALLARRPPVEAYYQRRGEAAHLPSASTGGRPANNVSPPETDLLSESFPEWEPFLHRGHGFVLSDRRHEEATLRAQVEFQRTEAESERSWLLKGQAGARAG